MTDHHRVYTKVLKMLKQMLELSRQGHVVTLAMMITGIVMGQKAPLSVMSSEVPVSAKEKSNKMRLRRWVKHSQIDADVIFMPFTRQILEALSSSPLVLVMDGSQAGRNRMVLMVGVLYKKRALPVAWLFFSSSKAGTIRIDDTRHLIIFCQTVTKLFTSQPNDRKPLCVHQNGVTPVSANPILRASPFFVNI